MYLSMWCLIMYCRLYPVGGCVSSYSGLGSFTCCSVISRSCWRYIWMYRFSQLFIFWLFLHGCISLRVFSAVPYSWLLFKICAAYADMPIKSNNTTSAYAAHILNNRHQYGTAENTLKLINPCRKGQRMNNWENLFIQIYRLQDQLITEQQVNEPNLLYELAQPPQNRDDSTHPDSTLTGTAQVYTHR